MEQPTKKRKYELTKDFQRKSSKSDLQIQDIEYLKCEICQTPVYHYKFCTPPHIYCSYECYAILALSDKNNYMDVCGFAANLSLGEA